MATFQIGSGMALECIVTECLCSRRANPEGTQALNRSPCLDMRAVSLISTLAWEHWAKWLLFGISGGCNLMVYSAGGTELNRRYADLQPCDMPLQAIDK